MSRIGFERMNNLEIEAFKKSRKWEALYWLSEGYTMTEMAVEMDLTREDTANRLHEARVLLGAKDNDELVVRGLILGLLEKRRDLK